MGAPLEAGRVTQPVAPVLVPGAARLTGKGKAVIPAALLDRLHCPYTGSPLALERIVDADEEGVAAGILRSDGYRFPIIGGVPILLPGCSALVQRIERGDIAGAFRSALYDLVPANTRTRRRRVLDSLGELRAPFARSLEGWERARSERAFNSPGASFRNSIRDLRPRAYADYFIHRYANPSLIAAVPLLPLLAAASGAKERWLLDLACGVGHSTALIKRLEPTARVIAVDHDFLNLTILSRFVAPGSLCICVDTEADLPFPPGMIDAVFCMDAFHYIHRKRALVESLLRVIGTEGVWLFPHLHNALVSNPSAGVPLSPDGYRHCFEPLPARFISEQAVLQSLATGDAIAIEDTSPAELERAYALTMISAPHITTSGWVPGTDRLQADRLALNPVFTVVERGSSVELSCRWPSPALEAECQAAMTVLPTQVSVDGASWRRITKGEQAPSDLPLVEELARRFVLVPDVDPAAIPLRQPARPN